MIGDGLGMLEGPAVFEIGCDASGAKRVAAGRVGQGGGLGPALDHVQHVESGHGLFAKPLALAHARNNGPFLSLAILAAAIQACRYSSSCAWQGTSWRLPPFSCSRSHNSCELIDGIITLFTSSSDAQDAVGVHCGAPPWPS